MKSMLYIAAALGAANAAPGPGGRPGLTLGTDSMFVDFNGASGGFKFFLQNNNNTNNGPSRRFWNMAYRSLTELDVNGTVVQRVRPVPLDLTLSSGNTTITNSDGTMTTSNWVNAYQPLNNGIVGSNIMIRHEVFSSPANFTRGNITIVGTANRLKISANITGWAFQANTNQLALSIKINDNFGGNDGPKNGGRIPLPGGGSARMPGGRNLAAGNNNNNQVPRTMTRLGCPPSPGGPFSGVIDLEDFVYLDGAAEPTAITINQNGNMYQLVFPYFAETAFYDPEVYTTTDSFPNGASSGVVAGVVGLAGVAAAAFLAL